ncbi:MAG: hypothetical protein ACI38A_01890 [Candidatus Ornithomonoglobus sp.]
MEIHEINKKIRKIEQITLEVMEDAISHKETGISTVNLAFLAEIIPFLANMKGRFIECHPLS